MKHIWRKLIALFIRTHVRRKGISLSDISPEDIAKLQNAARDALQMRTAAYDRLPKK